MGLIESNVGKRKKVINGLLSANVTDETLESLTTLQNEIGISFSTKVTAITSINDDELAAAFAKAYADTFSNNGLRTLIIDANLYNPLFAKLVKGNKKNEQQHISIDTQTSAICFEKDVYPSVFFKKGLIQKTIKENSTIYDRFVVLVPSIKEHKEVVLLSDILTSVILVTQKNVTKKEYIYCAIQYCSENNLPLAKTIIIK